MSQLVGQLDQSFEAIWVTNSGAVGRGVPLENLGPEQIAVFAADDYCGDGNITSLLVPSFAKNKRLIIKQGLHSFNAQKLSGISRKTKHPRQSIEFTANDIVNWKGVKGDSQIQKPQIVAIGYDGFDASKSLNGLIKDAKVAYVNIRISGEPIKRFFHTNFIDYRIPIDKALCLSNCECFDACGEVPCDAIADQIIKHTQNEFLFNQVGGKYIRMPFSQFLKVNKLKKCTTALTAPVLTENKKYSLTICDDGSTTIGRLQAAYPDVKIELESRVDSISTYSFWQLGSLAVPGNFTLTTHSQPVCDVCPDCPDTYTSVAGKKVVQIRVACGATAPTLTGQLSSTLISSSLDNGDIYLIKVPLVTTDAAIQTQLDALECIDGEIIGIESQSCVGSNVTFTWKTCESCFFTTKDWQIILPDLDCTLGTSRLAELQAAYPNLVITDDLAGACMHSYKTTTNSTCMSTEDCGKLVEYEFEAPASYDSNNWKDVRVLSLDPDCTVPAEVTPPCCVCGVAFETAFWDTTTDECTFGWSNWDPNFKKPVKISVNIHSYDYSENSCNVTPKYSTVLQKLTLNSGASGGYVQEREREHLIYEGKYWDANPYSSSNNGFKIVAKEHLIYDTYTLTLRRKQYGHSHFLESQGFIDYVFYVPTGEGKSLETYFNELVLSSNNTDLRAVIL